MLSILIPVYEFDIRDLVQTLQQQCVSAGIAFEILCFDDGSQESTRRNNQQIATLSGVRYEDLPQNIGRSAIRNALAEAAQYDYLLFMDNDSKVVREDYITQYLSQVKADRVICGGRSYAPTPPADAALYLHWLYGSKREQILAAVRQQNPWHGFMTNNFLMPKALFQNIGFDVQIVGYGHEDTLFGRELGLRKIEVLHIDNPLEHVGLEDKETFLKKAGIAVRNLHALTLRSPDLDTRLLRAFRAVKRYRLAAFLLYALHDLQGIMLANLRSKHPSLLVLDVYKLALLLWADQMQRASGK